MIYLRNKFTFIHAFRTGGLAVTNALLSGVQPNEEFLATTYAKYGQSHLWRHSTAREIRETVGEAEFDATYKFTIVRDPFDTFNSFYRLCKHDLNTFKGVWDQNWLRTCESFVHDPLDVAIGSNFSFLKGGLYSFHSSGLPVEPILWTDLWDKWRWIVQSCGLPRGLRLRHVGVTPGPNPSWSSEAIETVLELCADDFSRFNFKRLPR